MTSLLEQVVSRLRTVGPWSPRGRIGAQSILAKVNALEGETQALSEAQLRKAFLALRFRAKSGEPITSLLAETYALVREAGRRALNMRHFDVQILGGVALSMRSITEMQTGEGKTLTATLPLSLMALAGHGAHLATVNDYLARRDAEWMRPLYERLGLKVGVVESQSDSATRQAAYACDITYGTSKEFGFDFLRDRLVKRRAAEVGARLADPFGKSSQSTECVQRGQYFALVDEADSVLIDDAGTPLIISALPGEAQQREVEAYRFAATAVGHFVEQEHFHYHHDDRTAQLTPAGQRLARSLSQPDSLRDLSLVTLYEYLERAIRVRRDFHKDQQYVVRDGEIVIVDEFTGRLAEGRQWRTGIQQAVQAQEAIEITVDAGQAAQITVQDYFRRYQHLAGMTGTAASSSAEMRKIYKVKVVVVPTNRPSQRQQLPTRVTVDAASKWQAIVEEIRECNAIGRPVLVGTRSIDKSVLLSRLLTEAGIAHQVLNAHQVALEADIIAMAGQLGRVTVSTNMAGRGTDVRLGPGVAELGGLHVIATEMHEAQRIDRQLFGRCGRQGDPGTVRQYLALDDELLVSAFEPVGARRIHNRYAAAITESPQTIHKIFRRAQRRVERRQFRTRQGLMYHQRERRKVQRGMGQDPYLDCVG